MRDNRKPLKDCKQKFGVTRFVFHQTNHGHNAEKSLGKRVKNRLRKLLRAATVILDEQKYYFLKLKATAIKKHYKNNIHRLETN